MPKGVYERTAMHKAKIVSRNKSQENRDKVAAALTTHGQSMSKANRGIPSPTYKSWYAMRHRCMNPNASDYPYYGGRGIKICDAWASFQVFVADMGERPENKTLDRIDPNGNYEPSNCRWATRKEQTANRRIEGSANGTVEEVQETIL